MEKMIGTVTLDREHELQASVSAHPSNGVNARQSYNTSADDLIDNHLEDNGQVGRHPMEPFGSLVVGLANGVSIRHGIDALRISDTGEAIDSDMSRLQVFDQAQRVEAPETFGLMKSARFLEQRRASYLEFLGVTKDEIEENNELLNMFLLNQQTGADGLEHVLFGDTRYEYLMGKGVLTAEGLHFLPAAKKIGLDVELLKDYTRKGTDSNQRRRGVRASRLAIEGVEKASPTSMFPEFSPMSGEKVEIMDLLHDIKYAFENAQVVSPSSVKDGNMVYEFVNEDPESNIPSMRIITNKEGKIVSAFPKRK